MQLTGPQRRQLQAALLSAFPSLADLAQMVAYELDQTLSTIAGSANLTEAVVNLVDWAAAHEQLAALIRGAISANPDNPQLPALAAELGVSTAVEERTAPGPAAPDLFRVPYPRDPFFVGREKELSTLDEALRRETRGHGVLPILVGPAGIGKTRLAAEFAYRVRDRFPGGIFWLAMDPPEGVAAQVAALGGPDALNLPGATTLPLADQVAAVRAAWQESIPRLLVFDNLADPALLDQWRPRGGGTRVLATSRLPTWDSTGEARPLVLAPLERGADQELLLTPRALELGVSVAQLLADPGQRRAADAISRELNNLPLALTLAGTYLKTYSGVSLDQYLGQLQAGRAAPPPVEAEGPPGPSPSLDAAFALSYDRLDPRQDVDSLAQTLLQRAAQCAPAPIPRRLLVRAAGLDPDAAPAAALAGQALDRLAALGLLEPLPEGELRLHPLLAAAVRRRALDPAGDTAAVEAALIAEVRIVRQAGYPLAGRPYLPHLRHAVAAAEPRGDATAAALLNTLGTLLQDQGDYAAARPLLERALTIYEATLGPTHRDTVASLNNLALLLQVQGDYAGARPLYERALTISEATLGPTHPDTAVGLNNLAGLLQDQGDYAVARPLYERALAIYESMYGLTHPTTATSLNNLAGLLQDQGDYAGARPLYECALTIREATLGPTHPDTAQSLNNLAGLLQDQGDYAAARPLFERALAILVATLGPTHPTTAGSLNNLAFLLQAQGDDAAARPLYERALAIDEAALGPTHPATAQSLNNLGYLLVAQGDYAGARPLYERALAIREATLGPTHPATAQSLNNLAGLLQDQGDTAGARPLYERALAIREATLGPRHPDTASSLSNLASLLAAQRDDAGARPLYERALTIREATLGPSHPTTAQSLDNLASLLVDQGDTAAARPLFERALAANDQGRGPEAGATLISLNGLALLLLEIGELAAAAPLLDRLLASLDRRVAAAPDRHTVLAPIPAGLRAARQELETAQSSQSRRARSEALGRAVAALSPLAGPTTGTPPPPEVAFFRELVARWQALVTRLLTRAGQITIRERVSSPYLFTTPVRGAALVGREDVFDEIRRLWVRPGQRNSLLIHGHRRMGKTSVAQALGERCQLGADTRLLYRSMEGLHLERGQPGELYRALAFQFWLLVKDRLPRPDAAQLTGPAGRATFDEFLALFAEARGALRVVLVLDEFELLYHGLGTATANEVIKQLRDQTQTYPWLALALVGLSDLDDWRLSYHSPLLGWAPIAMDFLTPAQVANVLANPLRDADFPLDYSPDALSAIATQTHGQPYLVQIVGDLLVEHYNRLVFAEHQRHTDVFDAADVQAVLDDARFYETAAAYFEGVWGQAERGQAGETAVLTALAAQPAGLAEAALRAATGLADPAAFDKARDALARHKMILLVDGRWQHAVPLMARWVRHRPRPDAPAPGPDAGP